jgi:hypothetical protein
MPKMYARRFLRGEVQFLEVQLKKRININTGKDSELAGKGLRRSNPVLHRETRLQGRRVRGGRRWITLSLSGDRWSQPLELAKAAEDLAVVGKQGGSFPFLAFDTANCAGDYNAMMARGVKFHGKPETCPWGTL